MRSSRVRAVPHAQLLRFCIASFGFTYLRDGIFVLTLQHIVIACIFAPPFRELC
jgi:hypothetical protein